MAELDTALQAHLDSGATTLARAWAVTRRDGVTYGFTDHDCDLSFDGVTFRAGTGLTARVLAQSTGLSVDNTEALGALTSSAVTEADIDAGRFDGAEVLAWLVNWQDVSQRVVLFRGSFGEIRRSNGAFEAELRGLTEALNRPLGRIYQKGCTAVLGDGACRFDLNTTGYAVETPFEIIDGDRLEFAALAGFAEGWFAHGRLEVLSGAGAGLWAAVKGDRGSSPRVLDLWAPLSASVLPGDLLRLTAGCDKRLESCRLKFDNIVNFQGFPDIPGEDWMVAVPKSSGRNDGGSLR